MKDRVIEEFIRSIQNREFEDSDTEREVERINPVDMLAIVMKNITN